MPDDFARRLNAVLDQKNMTKAEASRICDMSTAKMSQLCSGQTKDPTLSTLIQLSLGLGVSLDYLCGIRLRNHQSGCVVLTDQEKAVISAMRATKEVQDNQDRRGEITA